MSQRRYYKELKKYFELNYNEGTENLWICGHKKNEP